ncbi:MAG: ABC transporter substrate-binding protein [Terriglobales bacterium]
MGKDKDVISRRDFIKVTGAGTLAAARGPFFLFPERAAAQQKTLKILQWSHFVPGYDKWFDGVFTKQWGQKNNTNVIVDHINLNEIEAHAAAEVSAKKGHDLFMFLAPPAVYENQVIDHGPIYQELQKKWGKPVDLAVKSTYNPKSKKYYAFSDSYVPDPGNYRQDLWSQVGYPNGPDTWDQLLDGARKIKQKFGNPCGVGLSQELDTNMAMRALMWSYGASVQDAEGRVSINSKQTIEALKYMTQLFKDTQTAEVFTWDPSSNNRAILSGRVSYVANAISVTRTAEKENPDMSKKIQIVKAPAGPAARLACEHVMDCYVIWNFAENKEGAQQFLVDLINNFAEAFKASEFYNFPCFAKTVPDLEKLLANDPKGQPSDKYKVLADALSWSTNVGHPGYATAAISEVFSTFVVPTMFAKAARGQVSPEQAAKDAEAEVKRIFAKWKQ